MAKQMDDKTWYAELLLGLYVVIIAYIVSACKELYSDVVCQSIKLDLIFLYLALGMSCNFAKSCGCLNDRSY